MDSNGILNKIKFDPTISIGHLASAALFAIGGITAWYNLKEDVSNIKIEAAVRWQGASKQLNDMELKNREQDLAMREMSVELKSELKSNATEIKQEIRDLRSDLRTKPK